MNFDEINLLINDLSANDFEPVRESLSSASQTAQSISSAKDKTSFNESLKEAYFVDNASDYKLLEMVQEAPMSPTADSDTDNTTESQSQYLKSMARKSNGYVNPIWLSGDD